MQTAAPDVLASAAAGAPDAGGVRRHPRAALRRTMVVAMALASGW